MTQRWKITIEYDGTLYSGWQKQKQDNVISVQTALEKAIAAFSGQEVNLAVAGRTDSGVHALGQVAHFDSEKDFTARTVRNAINAKLYELKYDGVVVRQAEQVSEDFHARFSATRRVYCYRILADRRAPLVLAENRYLHNRNRLDVNSMQEAANYLLGHHDFTSFRASACQGNSPMRTLDRVHIRDASDENFYHGQYLEIWVEAKSFLYNQVRNIVGSLIPVGEGKWQPEKLKEILEACDRTKGGKTAPPYGLYFMRVDYD